MSENLKGDEYRGQLAQAVLTNPEFKASFVDVRQALLDAIPLTRTEDASMREFLYTASKVMPMLEEALVKRLNAGVLATHELARLVHADEIEKKAAARSASATRRAPRRGSKATR